MVATVAAVAVAVPASGAVESGAPDSMRALDVLAMIPVEEEHRDGYAPDRFVGVVVNSGGCATRAEVLIRDALLPPGLGPACEVVAGQWLSAHDGVTVTDPALLDVVHLVGLDEAWYSGAWQWDDTRRTAYANDLTDPRTIRAVSREWNASRGAADPSSWLPLNAGFTCTYLADWVAVKARWGLSLNQTESDAIRNTLTAWCADQLVSAWPPTDPWVPPSTTSPSTTSPSTTSPTTTTVAVQPLLPAAAAGACHASYPDVCIPPAPPDLDCGDISQRRFTVLPPDPHGFDGDSDGIGCES